MRRVPMEMMGVAFAAGLMASCSSTNAGVGIPLSCHSSAPGTSDCGAARESCCTSPEVAGGNFERTYTSGGMTTGLADPATIGGFRLDKYPVTVGRFRPFAAASKGGWSPPAGSGKHTHLNGGNGLADSAAPGKYEVGWVTSDASNIAPTDANLACDPVYSTWTSAPGSHENLPIDYVNWYEAYAFCIWDGGFLPSEAEWQYAVAGGSQQREWPWGAMAPGMGNQYAIFGCNYPNGMGTCANALSDIPPVGTATRGAGLWGQLDLAGEMSQWILDLANPTYVDPCMDCAYLSAPPFSNRVLRGGAFNSAVEDLLPRDTEYPLNRNDYIGFRCARTP